jgi:hypothetical protein
MALAIKCHGQFYARDGQLKVMKNFEEVVKAPSLGFFKQTSTKYTGTDDDGKLQFRETEFINVRGILKKKLLPLILSKKNPGNFVRVRTVTIDEIKAADGEALELPVSLMSFSQIGALIKQRRFPIDTESYLDIDELRTDYLEYEQDPESFKRNQARRAKKRQEEREFMELNQLMPLNDLVVSSVSEPNVAPIADSAQRAGKKKGIAELSSNPVSAQPF